MLPLLGALGAGAVDSALVVNIIRYGLTVLMGTYLANSLKEAKERKDVFESKAELDALEASDNSESFEALDVSGEVKPGETSSEDLSGGDGSYSGGWSESWSPSVGGSNLLEVLSNSGEATAEGLGRVESSIREGFRRVSLTLEALRTDLQRLGGKTFQADASSFDSELVKALQGLGTLLGAIGLSLEGIRAELSDLRINTEVKLPDLFRVRLENEKLPIEVLNEKLPVDLPKEVVDSAASTKKVMDALSTPIEVNPEESITKGTPVEVIAKGVGVQAKTFADINSFEVDGDIPDLPSGVDLSKLFEFLFVSSQLKGGL